MTPKDAKALGAALIEAGILAHARPAPHAAKGQRIRHGTSAIDGRWAVYGWRCLIGCEHVAEALLEAGGWTVDAIRACRHPNPYDLPVPGVVVPVTRTVKRARRCPCPVHNGGVCEGAARAA